MKLYFTKQDWKVTTQLREAFDLLGDWDYEFTVKPVKKIRSVEYNNFYWAVIEIMAQWSGYSSEDLHELMKKEFLADQWITSKNDKRRKRKLKKSTTRLTTEEFWLYIEKVKTLWESYFNIDWWKYFIR